MFSRARLGFFLVILILLLQACEESHTLSQPADSNGPASSKTMPYDPEPAITSRLGPRLFDSSKLDSSVLVGSSPEEIYVFIDPTQPSLYLQGIQHPLTLSETPQTTTIVFEAYSGITPPKSWEMAARGLYQAEINVETHETRTRQLLNELPLPARLDLAHEQVAERLDIRRRTWAIDPFTKRVLLPEKIHKRYQLDQAPGIDPTLFWYQHSANGKHLFQTYDPASKKFKVAIFDSSFLNPFYPPFLSDLSEQTWNTEEYESLSWVETYHLSNYRVLYWLEPDNQMRKKLEEFTY